jgi:hypothetical protein
MGIPRLLYAYMRLDGTRTAFEIGQDHMILAPKNPTSLTSMAFPALYRSGNLYLRAPQLRVEQQIASGSAGELRATVGILAPIGGDLNAPALQFVPPNLAGERSRKPAAQARVAWRAAPARSTISGGPLVMFGKYSAFPPVSPLVRATASWQRSTRSRNGAVAWSTRL